MVPGREGESAIVAVGGDPRSREPLELRHAPRQPAQAALARVARDALLALPRNDVIELHDHVGAEVALDLHHALRRERVLRAVDVAAKLDAVLAHGAQPLEREDLKATGVGEDRPIPSHEPMQSAEIANQLVARPQVQMIRVGENHLRADRAEVDRDRATSPSRACRPP